MADFAEYSSPDGDLTMAESDPGFAKIVGGHLDVDLVANTDADEVFAHFTRDMRQDFMTIGKGHTKHRPRQHLRHRASEFNWFFFSHANGLRDISCHWRMRKSILKRRALRTEVFGIADP